MLDEALDRLAGRRGSDPVPLSLLMPGRVRNILLISSFYDSFTMEEDGRFTEALFTEYLSLNLRYAPGIQRASSGSEALRMLDAGSFDLAISMLRPGGMQIDELCREIHARCPGLPLVVFAYNSRDIELYRAAGKLTEVDKAFIWQGDVRLFIAVVKYVEDRMNAQHDADVAGVQSILLVEDSPRFCSSYLPMLYTEIMEQTQALMTEGVNSMQRFMRMRARPKILFASSYEEAEDLLDSFGEHILGAILDSRFSREDREDPAGFRLVERIRNGLRECPILLQSSEASNRERALRMGAAFVDKNSPNLLAEVREFLRSYLGFGDFVFRSPDGVEEARASDLRSMYRALKTVSDGTLLYHAARNDFSKWLMARTEFDLARVLRPQKVEDFEGVDELRSYLLTALKLWRERARAGQVEEFSSESFDADTEFVKIGSGSLGGKGRGLAFMNSLLNLYRIDEKFPGTRIFVPHTVVLATDVFDRFMGALDRKGIVLETFPGDPGELDARNAEVRRLFLGGGLPEEVVESLRTFLSKVRYPLAVRSSSLLEDSAAQPFAGVYQTYMIPNNSPDDGVRLDELCNAIRLVYASLYHSDSLSYMELTPNRLEEEKMAVVIQQVVGLRHGGYFYPDFAGVARSFNFYPLSGMRSEDGVASVALGLGNTVVEGGKCVRFSPARPEVLYQFASTSAFLANSQREFYAIELEGEDSPGDREFRLAVLDLEKAQEHGTLHRLGSVYSAENDRIYEGTFRDGLKLVTLSGVLLRDVFPLQDLLSFLLDVGKIAFGANVEMEFAVTLNPDGKTPGGMFGFLQIRPMGFDTGTLVDTTGMNRDLAFCYSNDILGSGVIRDISDVIYVSPSTFERAETPLIATEIQAVNLRLKSEDRSSILIGPGRWGSADRWLGIPVSWSQISTARCMVETPMEGITVTPSQGTHFFQNITSLGIGYFTVGTGGRESWIDSGWLDSVEPVSSSKHVRHLRFDHPLEVVLDAVRCEGMIFR
jgi:CheY-like chemotaxis protein